jgi:uncharacterized membrane protein
MMVAAILLVLLAANLHAIWNLLLKESSDPLPFATRAAVISAIIWAPFALVGWLAVGRQVIPPEAWVLAVASALLEAAYFIFLSRAYRLGHLSAVYPLARGTAPILAVCAGLLVLHEKLTPIELAGVLLVLAGIWLVQRPLQAGPATVAALLTAVTIASYSAIDSVGVHRAAPWLYGWIVWAITAALLSVWSLLTQRSRKESPGSEHSLHDPGLPKTTLTESARSALVGMLMTSTYLIILIALRLAPLAIVAPLRESSIVFVTIWAVWRLGERDGQRMRLAGAVGIALGAALIAL